MKTIPFLFALILPALLHAEEVKITLPTETGTYKAGAGSELAQANCLMCHSTEYVSTQPPMPRKFWEASVKKMKEKFGAPTPDAQVPALVDYLTANYGVPDKPTP
jgi:mono/diheme cytochrome c family protein